MFTAESVLHTHDSNLGKVRQIKPAQLAFRRTINIILLTYLLTREQRRCAEAHRNPQNIWNALKNCGYFVDGTSSEY